MQAPKHPVILEDLEEEEEDESSEDDEELSPAKRNKCVQTLSYSIASSLSLIIRFLIILIILTIINIIIGSLFLLFYDNFDIISSIDVIII